jgi:hypothetical protein
LIIAKNLLRVDFDKDYFISPKDEGYVYERGANSSAVVGHLQAAIEAAKTQLPGVVDRLKLVLAEITGLAPLAPPPARHDAATLERVAEHARTAPWPGNRSLRAPEFIREHYGEWLAEPDPSGHWAAPTLWREDLAKADPKLIAAYSTAVSRDASRAVTGLYVRPTKIHPAHSQASSKRVVAEMTSDELAAKRARGRVAQQAYARRKEPMARRRAARCLFGDG